VNIDNTDSIVIVNEDMQNQPVYDTGLLEITTLSDITNPGRVIGCRLVVSDVE